MKILQVVPSITDSADGPSYSVPALCRALIAAGGDVRLTALAPLPASLADIPSSTYPRRNFPHPDLGRSPEMLQGLKDACRDADIIHNNSLWMLPNIYPEFARRNTRCKLVVMPRGTLSNWSLKRSRWKKAAVYFLAGQRTALRNADLLIATGKEEYREFRDFGLTQPIAVIPNGIDLPLSPGPKCRDGRKMVFLSRIHPKKRVDMLLHCWKELEAEFPDWKLEIAGSLQNDYAGQMQALCRELACARVTFLDEVRGTAKFDLLGGADCFVLPTHSENFGLVVAEALASATPVITTDETPWGELNDRRAGWCVKSEKAEFLSAMREAMNLSRETLTEMGDSGRRWMQERYSWDGVADNMMQAYGWLLHGGRRPASILTN